MKKTDTKKNAAAQALTALRNKKLSPVRRKQIAQEAAAARWSRQLQAGEESHV